MDKVTANRLLTQIEQAVKRATGNKYRVQRVRGGFRSEGGLTVKFEIAAVVKGVVEDSARAAFKALAPAYGLKATDLGKRISWCGKQFTVVGLAPKARTYPLVCAGENGRRFRLPLKALGKDWD